MVERGFVKRLPPQAAIPVKEYRDKVLSIKPETSDTCILFVPFKEFQMCKGACSRAYKYLERLVYNCCPKLEDYSKQYLYRILNVFQEFTYEKGSIILKPEKSEQKYAYIIG